MDALNPQAALFADFSPISKKDWEEKIQKDLKGEIPDTLTTPTYEGITIEPFYTAADITNLTGEEPLPGKFPYIRGHKSERNQWQNLQEIQVSTDSRAGIDKAVQAIRFGADGVHFRMMQVAHFDLAYLVAQLPVNEVIICFSLPGGQAGDFLVNLYRHLQENRISPYGLKGFVFVPTADPGFFGRASASDLESIVQKTKDTVDFYGITVDGAQFGNRGANLVQQIAFTLSLAVDYLEELSGLGIPVATIARNMQFYLSTDTHYFFEIVKLRALRWLWSAIIKATEEDTEYAAALRIHATTSRWHATTFDPHTNILRATTQAMSAIMGGCDSVAITPFDITFQEENSFSERIARNIPLLLKHETYLDQALDPAAGSYYLESLTQEMAEKAWDLFKETAARGGFTQALQTGFIQEQITTVAQEQFRAVATGQDVLVGTNKFANKHEKITYNIEALMQGRYFDTSRASYPFEVMRMAALLHYQRKNQRPKAVIAIIGTDIQEHIHGAFAKEFFECGDFDTEILHFNSVSAALEKLLFTECRAIVFSSSETEYERFSQHFTGALKNHKNRPLLILAAPPEEMKEELEENGFDGRIFQNCNAASIIGRIQQRLLSSEV